MIISEANVGMPNNNSITILIPTLNEQDNLRRCLSSIKRQKYGGKIEVIVADGGSSDNTRAVAKEHGANFINNPKRDAESGKLLGLKFGHSYYFMILDADMSLEGTDWFKKIVKPLEENPEVVGSFTKFVSHPEDSVLSKFITIDEIQRDPLFRYLTPDLDKVIVAKRRNYYLCRYKKDKIVPAGFCLYRKKQLLKLGLDKRYKFMELDTLSIFVSHGLNLFAYVPSAGIHHPFLKDLKMLFRKRTRNLNQQFFNQPDERQFTWVDFAKRFSIIQLAAWVLYANSLILPFFVGIYRTLKYKNLLALYEPVFVWVTTNLTLLIFLKSQEGRNLIAKSWRI